MKDYIRFELKAFVKKRKTLYLVITLLVAATWLFAAIQFQDFGDHEGEMYNELNETRLALRSIETYYRNEPDEQTLADNVFEQQSLTASMYNGLIFDESEWLNESARELGELRIEFAALNNEEELPNTLFPPLHESKRQVAEYSALSEMNHPLLKNSRNTADYLRLLMQYFGIFAFLFLVIFASDIGIADFEHQSMVKGYPLNPIKRLLTQVGIYLLSILGGSLLVLTIATLFVSVFWQKPYFTYPMALYSFSQFQALPVWQGLQWFILYYAFLAFHVIVLCMLLNRVFKNMYATLIAMTFIFGVPLMFPNISNILVWTPLPYYHMTSILQGAIAEKGASFAHLQSGIILLTIYSILALLIIAYSERRQATAH